MLSGGQVKVLDFGIARASDRTTGTQAVLGTAAYLSPEQASGGLAGPQADLYSLGCVLFEMLTGAPPFTGDSPVAVAYRHVHEDPGPPSARRPGIPAPLDEITLRLLAKDPSARPPGAATARAALLAAVSPDHTAVLDAAPGSSNGAPRWRPRPAEAVLAAALLIALAALATVLLTRPAGTSATPAASPGRSATTSPAQTPSATATASVTPTASALPSTAAAAAAFVGDLEAGVASGQVSQQAGQNLFNQLQQLLFSPPGRGQQQVDQQYAQLVQVYDQDQAQGR